MITITYDYFENVFNYIIIITITYYDNPRSDGKMGSYEI